MNDNRTPNDVICRKNGCDDVKILACKANSGAINELLYCEKDGCYYVTIDGRERLRSDVPSTAFNFFSSWAPD